MPLVLDSSIAMALVMEDEDLTDADAFLGRLARERAIVPPHWELEVANALISAARRQRMPSEQCRIRFDLAMTLPINFEPRDDNGAIKRTIDGAMAHGLTAYDAAYLELAMRRGFPLATLDGPLAEAARAEGVEVVGADV